MPNSALLCLLLGTLFLSSPPSAPQDPLPAQPAGHLVLVVTGDARQLQIEAAVRKPDPFGGVPKGLISQYRLSIRDGKGVELGSYPLDLSHFDLDPANAGKPLRVTGCTFRSTTVALPVSVPDFPQAASIVILSGERQLGATSGAALQALLAGGGR
jgi:hypothetical protein